MAARTGAQYIDGLHDDRSIWVDGGRVSDVTDYPGFTGSLQGLAGYFDWQHSHANECLSDGENISHRIPRCLDDLSRRHVGLERLARYSAGMLGRTPDYVNVTFAGFAGQPGIWKQAGNDQGYENLIAFQREAAERDLALTHTIIHPIVDKRVRDYEGENRRLALNKVDETTESIVVSGARILATLGPFADELTVYPGHPIPTDQPELALAFSVPMNAPGLKVICRDHYGVNSGGFDRPFSSRFDEQDAFIVFDEVEIPKCRVFCDGLPEVYNSALGHGWTGNIMQQTSIRAQVKLEFAYELATRMAVATGQNERPDVAQLLGELWSYAELTRSAVHTAESQAFDYGDGAWFCDERPFVALRPTMPGWMVRANEILKLIGSHNLLATPAAADFDDEELKPILDKYLKGAAGMDAKDRSRLFRTAWDFVGSALGGRTELYERFYLASSARMYGAAHALAQRDREWEAVPTFWSQTDR